MAMRNLLRRIPARASSGPLMGPVRGVSPARAAAVPRFLSTQSEGEQCTAEALADYLESEKQAKEDWELSMARQQKFIEELDRKRKEWSEISDQVRRDVEDMKRYGRQFAKFADISTAVMFASSVVAFCFLIQL